MKKTTVIALVALILAIVSCFLAFSDKVLTVIVTGPLAAIVALIVLVPGWKNKLTRLISFITIALSIYSLLEFQKVNQSNKVKEVEVEEGESETDKQFEDELYEDGFDDAFGEEEEIIE